MFDAFTLQNLVIGLDDSQNVQDFKNILLKFCGDMGYKDEFMDDHKMAHLLLTTLSNKFDIGIIDGKTTCDKCGSDECIATIDLNLMQYIDKEVILETNQFILKFKRNILDEDMDAISFISEAMHEITVKETNDTFKISEIDLDEDIDNILSFITEEELGRLTNDILEGGVIVYATDKCKECEYSSSYGVFNLEDIVNLLIQGFLENEGK